MYRISVDCSACMCYIHKGAPVAMPALVMQYNIPSPAPAPAPVAQVTPCAYLRKGAPVAMPALVMQYNISLTWEQLADRLHRDRIMLSKIPCAGTCGTALYCYIGTNLCFGTCGTTWGRYMRDYPVPLPALHIPSTPVLL